MKNKVSIINQSYRFNLGIDAEVVPTVDGQPVYPHQVGLRQQRGDRSWSNDYSDWHGDGFAFEICTRPDTCIDQVCWFVGQGLNFLTRKLSKLRNVDAGKVFTPVAPTLYEVPISVVEEAPPEARRLGCAPSFNVYVAGAAMPEKLGNTKRTTGCHLHLSDTRLNNEMAQEVIKWADIFVGTTWTYIANLNHAEEKERREAYGRAGEHRRNIYPPSPAVYPPGKEVFGVEYRALPGAVLHHNVYLSLMLRLYRAAAHQLITYGDKAPEVWTTMAVEAINNSDQELAGRLIAEIPYTERDREMIEWYKANPFGPINADVWEINGRGCMGCVSYFSRRKV